jgi:ribosomal protein S18 acetylase RimI-like enzyme
MKQIDPSDVTVRVLRGDDYPAIVEIDARVGGKPRPEYYERKMRSLMDGTSQIVSSLAAEHGGVVVGFLMGQVCDGEFGAPESMALVDTIGVDPDYQRAGVARIMFEEFMTSMKAIGVTSVRTLVHWNSWDLIKFFDSMGFTPEPVLNLERKL